MNNDTHDTMATAIGATIVGAGVALASYVGYAVFSVAVGVSTPAVAAPVPATIKEIKAVVEPAVDQWSKDGWTVNSKVVASFESCKELAKASGSLMKMSPNGSAGDRTPNSDTYQVKGILNGTDEMVIQCSRGTKATVMMIASRKNG